MPRPEASLAKSWSSTSRSVFRQQRPGFLKLPTRSFFLVSTLRTGRPCVRYHQRIRVRERNCRYRSGWCVPAIRFRLVRSDYSCWSSNRATVFRLTAIPRRRRAAHSFRVNLCVHFRAVIGSPAVASWSNWSNASTRSGSFFFDPLAVPAWLPSAGGVDALRLQEFPLPPVDRRATQPGDDRQPCDPSPTVDRRPEAGEQPTPLLIQDGDQLIDGPMLLDDGASPASLAIGATADMDGSVIGLGLHGSPPSFERKEANRL